MGAHFAPPFAIITMHKIETIALQTLAAKHEFFPSVYVRYIDDILIGPVDRHNDFSEIILEVFNSINDSICFTLEAPSQDNKINFLDLSIKIGQNKVYYTWFTKACHSEISLRKDSFLPSHVKNNFVKNYVNEVDKKCSSVELKKVAHYNLKNRLNKNGHDKIPSPNEARRKKNITFSNSKPSILVLNFINDRCNRKINKIIRKYDFKIKVANKPAKQLRHCLNLRNSLKKHENCKVCSSLPPYYRCDDRFLVYKFTCSLCFKAYIGETSRPFRMRHSEHERSLSHKNRTSALAEHALICHNDVTVTIDDFDLEIVKKCSNPIETRLAEANAIQRFGPELNRKHESI